MDIENSDKNRRKSDSYSIGYSPDKYPKEVQELVEKKIASEYQFNRQARVNRAKSIGVHNSNEHHRRSSSITDKDMKQLKEKYHRHHGDENLTDSDLTASRKLSDEMSGYDSMEKEEDSDVDTLPLNVSPLMIRRHSHSQENPQIGSKIDLHLAKLAQMKLKLDPLPNRRRTKSLVYQTEEH